MIKRYFRVGHKVVGRTLGPAGAVEQEAAVNGLLLAEASPDLLASPQEDLNLLYVAADGLVYETPTRPDGPAEFDAKRKIWIDPRTLAELKAAKRAEITAWRRAADADTFTFGGKRIQADAEAQRRINAVATIRATTGALPALWLGVWKTADNTYITIPDVATWDAFYAAMVAQGTANFIRSETLKARLAAATTAAKVAAITWSRR